MRFILGLALCLALCLNLVHGARLLEVNKTVEAGPKAGHYTATVSYRALGTPGRVFNVRIVDSLPTELDLVSGDLVAKVEDVRQWREGAHESKITEHLKREMK